MVLPLRELFERDVAIVVLINFRENFGELGRGGLTT